MVGWAAMRRLVFGAMVAALTGMAPSIAATQAASMQELDKQLDFVIRSACHGYMVDAIPDFLSGIRDKIKENSPFCQTVNTLPEDESAYALLQKQDSSVDYSKDPRYKINGRGTNADLYRYSDCDDWMCEHIRSKLDHAGHPISLADYRKVEQHCAGRGQYGCIEDWFKTWPRPLPEVASTPAQGSLSLDGLMGGSTPAPSARPETSQRTAMAAERNASATSPDVSLDNVLAGREEIALGKITQQINRTNGRTTKACLCSLNKSGCYHLPDHSLLEKANALELSRYQLCSEWDQSRDMSPDTSAQAKTLLEKLSGLSDRIAGLDKDMQDAIETWDRERRERLAEQQREAEGRSSSAYFAGVASILLQTGAAMNGSITPEQAAQNAVNVSNSVQSGDGWAAAMGKNIVSALPGQMRSNMATSSSASADQSSSGQASSAQEYTINETYSYTCDSGAKGSAPIKAKTVACANATKRLVKVAGCNLFEEQDAAQAAYDSACGVQ